MSKKKMCETCAEFPATIPDRGRPGRLINRICHRCHGARLRGDMKTILEIRERRKKEQGE